MGEASNVFSVILTLSISFELEMLGMAKLVQSGRKVDVFSLKLQAQILTLKWDPNLTYRQQGKVLGHKSEFFSIKCVGGGEYGRKTVFIKFFRIILKFVKQGTHLLKFYGFKRINVPCSRFLSLWELQKVNFKSDWTQTFPDTYSNRLDSMTD